jgi:hypothetical protein
MLTVVPGGKDVKRQIEKDLATEHKTRRMMTKPYCEYMTIFSDDKSKDEEEEELQEFS